MDVILSLNTFLRFPCSFSTECHFALLQSFYTEFCSLHQIINRQKVLYKYGWIEDNCYVCATFHWKQKVW